MPFKEEGIKGTYIPLRHKIEETRVHIYIYMYIYGLHVWIKVEYSPFIMISKHSSKFDISTMQIKYISIKEIQSKKPALDM